jgi:hypothetical protein
VTSGVSVQETSWLRGLFSALAARGVAAEPVV